MWDSDRQEDLRRYLVSQVPMHVYYSSAHYENPSAPKMEQKGWRGADLVFDLDADHIPGAERMTYEEMLHVVKQDMIRLLDDFLLGDLGFAEDEVRITFSGGRGYHAHVQSDRVQRLGSHERSEVVDFVSGTDLDFELDLQGALLHEEGVQDRDQGGDVDPHPARGVRGMEGQGAERASPS